MKHIEARKVLLNEIRGGRWNIGDRLLPERQLAKELSISRVTVRLALRRLIQHGVIEQRQGSGTYLKRIPDDAAAHDAFRGGRTASSRQKQGFFRGKRIVTQRLFRFAFLHDMSETDLVAMATLGGVMAYANRRGHEIVVGPSREPADAGPRRDFTREVYHPTADGIILAATFREEDFAPLKKSPVPTVLLSSGGASARLPNAVSLDTVSACQQAVQELASEGHKRIAVLEKSFGTTVSRFAATVNGLSKELELPSLSCHFADDPFSQLPGGPDAPTALYIADDVYCVEVCQRLAEAGVRVGRDIAVICQSNRGIERGIPPRVGRMEFDTAGWGRMAAHMLEYMLDDLITELPPIRLGARHIARSGA